MRALVVRTESPGFWLLKALLEDMGFAAASMYGGPTLSRACWSCPRWRFSTASSR